MENNILYVKDTREGRIYEVKEIMGKGWYRCYRLDDMNYANNSTIYVEYNGKGNPDKYLVTSNKLSELVDVYMKDDNGITYGYVKTKNKFGGHKYIPATFIDKDNKERLLCLEVYR